MVQQIFNVDDPVQFFDFKKQYKYEEKYSIPFFVANSKMSPKVSSNPFADKTEFIAVKDNNGKIFAKGLTVSELIKLETPQTEKSKSPGEEELDDYSISLRDSNG